MFFSSNLFPKGSDPRKPSPNKIHLGPRSNPLASKRRYRAYLKKKKHVSPRKINGWNLTRHPWKRKIIFQTIHFQVRAVSFREGNMCFFCKKMDPETSRFHEFSSHFLKLDPSFKKFEKRWLKPSRLKEY